MRPASLALLILFALPLHAQDSNQADGKDGKSPGFRVAFNNRPSFRFGKVVRIDLRVKSQGDFRAFSPDLSTDQGEFDFQRMRIGVEGNILEELEYQVEHEFREYFWDGRTSKDRWRDVFVNFRYFRNFQVQIGKFKAPFSLEQLTGTHNLDFVLRSRIADNIAPGRAVGVSVHGRFLNRGLNYEFGAFRTDGEDEDAESVDAESSGRRMYAARVTATPLRLVAPGPLKDLELGVAATSSNIPEGLNGLRGKTASGKTFFLRLFVRGTRFRLGTEMNWTPGPFSLKGEFIHARDQREDQSVREVDLPELIARGWYLTGTWAITGEKKADGIEPRRPLFAGGVGAIELTGRYEQLRFNSSQHAGAPSRNPRASNILANSDRIWTVGVNWYPNRFTKVQVNGVHDRIKDSRGPDLRRSPILDRTDYWMGILRLQFVM